MSTRQNRVLVEQVTAGGQLRGGGCDS